MTKEEMKLLYDNNYHALYGYIATLIPKEFIHDIIMDVFTHLFNDPRFDYNRDGAKSYLFRSVRNRCVSVYRREKLNRELEYKLSYSNRMYSEKFTIIDPDLGEEQKEIVDTIDQLKNIISLLPGIRMKEILKMSFIEGVSNEEISIRLGLKPMTVRNTKCTGLKLIKKQLQVA